jgi:type I restriction enzyme R subunit
MEKAENTLEDFKFKDMPRIAISVDMLDTGIDIPAIQTLLFAKPVFSLVPPLLSHCARTVFC